MVIAETQIFHRTTDPLRFSYSNFTEDIQFALILTVHINIKGEMIPIIATKQWWETQTQRLVAITLKHQS